VDLKLTGLVAGPRLASSGGGAPTPVWRNHRDFNQQAAAGPYNNVALQVLKAIICCRQHTVAQRLL
jgi:hypothetical protein